MTEKLTLKKLSGELEVLRARVLELEQQLEHKLEHKLKSTLDRAVAKLVSGVKPGNLPEHGTSIDTEHRQRLIAEAAYLIAEQRGFQGGDPAGDWASAEKQVDYRLMQENLGGKPAVRKKRSVTKKTAAKPSGTIK